MRAGGKTLILASAPENRFFGVIDGIIAKIWRFGVFFCCKMYRWRVITAHISNVPD